MADDRTEAEIKLQEMLAEANKRADENYQTGRKWVKENEALQAENSALRIDLHNLTVEKARLEGYIDRTREFDPPEEPQLVVPPRNRRAPNRSIADELYEPRRKAWYLRG